MSLKLYRPTPDGLEPASVETRNWRGRLRSRRWQPAELANPEARATTPLMGVLFFGGLAALTFVIVVLGYASRFWG